MISDGLGKGIMHAFSMIESKGYGTAFNACDFRPFPKRFGPSFVGNKPVSSGIVCLFLSCSPTAVVGFVIAVIIFSFDAVLIGWSWSHISKEVCKRFSPSFANMNAPVAIAMVIGIVGYVATGNHPRPGFILPCFCHAMFCLVFGTPFLEIASTTEAFAKFQGTVKYFFDGSAFASAPPVPVFVGFFHDCPSAK